MAAIETSVKIHGAREISAAMRALPPRIERRLLNRSLLAGAKPIVQDARRRAPVLAEPDPRRRAGTVRRAIRAGAVRPQGVTATVYVRVRGLTQSQIRRYKQRAAQGKVNASNNPNDPFYWRFIEFGTSTQPARPFLRPAFESRKGEFVQAMINDLRPRMQAEIARLGAANRFGRR